MVKDLTKTVHEEVEQLLLPRLTAIQNQDDYAAILKMFYGYFYPLEKIVQSHISPSELPDVTERRQAASIVKDLQAIGHGENQIALCTQLPQIEKTAQAAGALYVLEGSTLGGKVIVKMLRRNKGAAVPENALRFFEGYGEETGNKWKAFLQFLNRQENTNDVVAAANETFLYLKYWMQHTLYHV